MYGCYWVSNWGKVIAKSAAFKADPIRLSGTFTSLVVSLQIPLDLGRHLKEEGNDDKSF